MPMKRKNRWIFRLNGDLMAIWSHNDVHLRITVILIAKLMVTFILIIRDLRINMFIGFLVVNRYSLDGMN